MLTYTGVTEGQFAGLQSSMARQGFALQANAGVIKKLGAVVGYSYSPAAQTLDVDVRHAPWTVKLSSFSEAVDAELRKALEANGPSSSGGSAQIAEHTGQGPKEAQ